MTRHSSAALMLLLMAGLLLCDILQNPPSPYAAPTPVAIGSGVKASGGFCGSLPPKNQ